MSSGRIKKYLCRNFESKRLKFSTIFEYFRTENSHISQTFAFANPQMKILDENGQDSQLQMKKGEKYQIQFDLEDNLASNCQAKNNLFQKDKILKNFNEKIFTILITAQY